MNQLGGNTAQTNIAYTGMQAPIAPDDAHHIIVGHATSAGETALTNADVMSINVIPKIIALAQGELPFPIKPVVIKGVEVAGILFMTAQQIRDLKTNFSSSEWGDIYRAAIQGGQVTGNPINQGGYLQ